MNEKILIIEDEEDLVKGLKINLLDEGYKVDYSLDGKEGLSKALSEKPDLILLDIMLPGMNGLEICKELRRKNMDIPILMLTAKGEEIDKVIGLEMGADDYISKPFSIRELLARIKAHLRREKRDQKDIPEKIELGHVVLDFSHLKIIKKNKEVYLTFMEAEILKYLISKKGKIVTRNNLLDNVWGYERFPTTRTIDNHILKLRKKIEEDPNHPKHILTVYGGGYRFIRD
ncbi:MAG: response regulator transcription factor [Prolixibacteraceae bacterium]|mgnify:CR=1 FL=1|jgi:two-component system, OmpR family, alkaline phosphatase synthesis response regulator PhoP|nr:response regulator transcription factor [Prolixibacteraceae bacterium]MBT6006369.1 response regulator transcription factor [Prolixibacteraceae bacterium]MBT6997440.1 response regulator transcription factor [Prolixibacteraceae bacterium]MBT7396651.1 response regulator transcription factor [Prolixibacteraceae bacterium]